VKKNQDRSEDLPWLILKNVSNPRITWTSFHELLLLFRVP